MRRKLLCAAIRSSMPRRAAVIVLDACEWARCPTPPPTRATPAEHASLTLAKRVGGLRLPALERLGSARSSRSKECHPRAILSCTAACTRSGRARSRPPGTGADGCGAAAPAAHVPPGLPLGDPGRARGRDRAAPSSATGPTAGPKSWRTLAQSTSPRSSSSSTPPPTRSSRSPHTSRCSTSPASTRCARQRASDDRRASIGARDRAAVRQRAGDPPPRGRARLRRGLHPGARTSRSLGGAASTCGVGKIRDLFGASGWT